METEQQKRMWLTAYCAALNRLMAPGKSESKDMFRECGVCADRAVEAFNCKWDKPSIPMAPLRG